MTTTIQTYIDRARVAQSREGRARNLIDAGRHIGGRSPVGWNKDSDPLTMRERFYLHCAMDADGRRRQQRGITCRECERSEDRGTGPCMWHN